MGGSSGAWAGLGVRAARGLLAVAAIVGLGAILTAANSVPNTAIGQSGAAVTADALKPAACAGISLGSIVTGAGTFSGSGASDLVAASAGADTITALGGNDCVQGGGSDDDIDGGPGTDVCIGGPGTDTFTDCETTIQ